MAMPAYKLEEEDVVEARVAVLEANIEHIRADISEMKVDIKDLQVDVRRLNDKIDAVEATLTAKIDGVTGLFYELKISRAADRVWWLLMSAALLGVMARGFKWI